ncbi:acyl-CoA synthetase [Hoyosella altamirensis]|uniref:Fatty-acyl-CoA synthase n=1 Tax=Hoyosella altamirensis TaxID=616997 RepID=A0A839RRW3_9ACTN|nr:acyl-CoA synthetase [Hoyosella altamirensis]MBB3039702.1 fatty-acyl-CoA synthase [Hoyosella altamirensis]
MTGIRALTDFARSVRVIYGAGLVPVRRLDNGVRTLRATHTYGPFVGAMHNALLRGPDRIALIDEDGPLTYAGLDRHSNALARAWASCGLGSESTVAALCRDHRGLVVSMLAAGKIGARLVLLNTGFAGPQLAGVVSRERVNAVVYDAEFQTVLAALPDSVSRYLAWEDDGDPVDSAIPRLKDLIAEHPCGRVKPPRSPGGFVLLTSGTTGTPKGAPRNHTSVLASAQFLDRIPLREGGTTYMAAPIFHGTGLSQFVLSLALGCTVIMDRRFDAARAVAQVARYRADTLILVPTMLQRIVDLGPAVLAKHDTSTLRIIFAAGSALSPDLCRRTAQAFGDVLYNLYGSTEVAVATVATPAELRSAPGTAGRPPVACRVALYDTDGQAITKPNATGRIFVKSGLSFTGYTDGRRKEVIDGMLSSGDVGHFDDNGLLFVDGREDDMIVSGGENVYPLEVENLLADHDDVLDAAVIGVPDSEFGHRLRAFVVRAPGATVDTEVITDYVKGNLARYKAPREVIFIDELPRNATGKVLRRELEAWKR